MSKSYGMMISGPEAVRLLEQHPMDFPEYERVLNRVRYEVDKSVPIAPKKVKAVSRSFQDYCTCGNCGVSLHIYYEYCPKCGRAIKWSAVYSNMLP